MFIKLIYINGGGKLVEKDFSEPMEVIGYIYRCWRSAQNAISTRRINEMLDRRAKELTVREAEEGGAE